MRITSFSGLPALLVVAIGVAVLAACGGGGESGAGPQVQVPSTPSASASDPAPAPSGTTAPPASSATAMMPPVVMKPVVPTAMEAGLQEMGLDVKALPPLNKLDPKTLREVMKTFTKALGVQCSGCHDTKDFKAPTAKKKIAAHMWNDFTRGLAHADGTPIYCDSCHSGRATLLDRRDTPALAEWMKQNYDAKLRRVDGKDHNCETCHGDPFEGKIFTVLWK